MVLAACRIVSSGLATRTSRVMASLTFIATSYRCRALQPWFRQHLTMLGGALGSELLYVPLLSGRRSPSLAPPSLPRQSVRRPCDARPRPLHDLDAVLRGSSLRTRDTARETRG